jgi:hypothetical protein
LEEAHGVKAALDWPFPLSMDVELFNALVVFPALFVSLWTSNRDVGLASLAATFMVCLLLIVGSVFSLVKYRDLKSGTQKIGQYEDAFRALRKVIPFFLLGTALVILVRSWVAGTGETLFNIGLFVLAVLEYINYFHVQLMYDTPYDIRFLLRQKKLKQGLIPREFRW